MYLFKLRGNVDILAVKSKFNVGAATSVVATSTVLGASVVLEDADGTAVEPAIPPVVVVIVVVSCTYSSRSVSGPAHLAFVDTR